MSLGVAIVGLVLSTASAVKQSADAKSLKRERTKQALLMQKKEEARARRQARIARARSIAQQGAAGAGGSIFEGFQTGVDSSLQGGIDFLSSQTQTQINQFGIEASATQAQALGSVASSAGNAAGTYFGGTTPSPSTAAVTDTNYSAFTATSVPSFDYTSFLRPSGGARTNYVTN